MPTKSIIRKLRRCLRIRSELKRCFLAEFLGTCILVLLVDGAGASVKLSGFDPIENTLWLSWAACFAIGFGIYTAYGVSGGHVNPAITIGLASTGKFEWRKVPVYWTAQLLGALTGASIVYLVYLDAINDFDGGTRVALGVNGTAGIFTTFPADYLTMTTGFFEQIVNTGIMLGLVHVIGDTRNAGPVFSLQPFFYGCIVFVVILSFSVNAGSPLNPSRDLAGRLITSFAGYGSDVWVPNGRHWWWIGTFGPLAGAVVGSWVYFLLVEIHHPLLNEREENDNIIVEKFKEEESPMKASDTNL